MGSPVDVEGRFLEWVLLEWDDGHYGEPKV